MAREFSRRERVADYLKRELSVLIQRELRDPRLGMISVTAVEVSRDIGYAKVYFTRLDSDSAEQAEPATKALDGAAGYLRSLLARDSPMRSVPQLRFVFDTSVGRGREMEALIDRAKAADAAQSDGSTDAADGDGADDGSDH